MGPSRVTTRKKIFWVWFIFILKGYALGCTYFFWNKCISETPYPPCIIPGSSWSKPAWPTPNWRNQRVGNNSWQTSWADCIAASSHLWNAKQWRMQNGQFPYLSSILLASNNDPRHTRYNCGSWKKVVWNTCGNWFRQLKIASLPEYRGHPWRGQWSWARGERWLLTDSAYPPPEISSKGWREISWFKNQPL